MLMAPTFNGRLVGERLRLGLALDHHAEAVSLELTNLGVHEGHVWVEI